MLFCSGHTLMADGRLMVSGGHKDDDTGIDVTNIFDPASETWATGRAQDGLWSVVSDGDHAAPTAACSPWPDGTRPARW